MIEVHPNLFVGDDSDAANVGGEPGWFVVHAAKEPYHRAALGYTGQGAPKGHPEYLFAHRDGSIALNLIDGPEPAMIPREAITEALRSIQHNITNGRKVLVHCNQGRSRSPTISLLWMCLYTTKFDDCDFDQAVARFTEIYPAFAPAAGMAGYARDIFAGGDPDAANAVTNPTTPSVEAEDLSQPEPTRRPAHRAIFTL